MLARFEWRLHRSSRLQPADRTSLSRRLPFALGSVALILWLVYHHLIQPAWLQQIPSFLGELLTLLEYAAVITAVVIAAVIAIRAVRQSRLAAGNVTTDMLYALSPSAFERYVAELFRQRGYKVRVRGRSGDHGVDLELTRGDNRRAIVQCKRYRNPIGPDIVRELFGTMIHEGAHHAFLVTTADVSPAAREWAADKPMTLIDGSALVEVANSLNGSK
jgi:restriction system protein